MYLTPTDKHWACDIEADNLLDKATRIWCATLINLITKEKVKCLTAEDFTEFQKVNPDAIYVGHNFISYDAPMLNKFWKAGIGVRSIVDTFVLSMLYNPNYPRPKGLGKKGPHSLEAWGLRLRYPKGDFDDFSKYSEEMLEYCMRDTILTALLFTRLSERMRQFKFTEMGAEIEHKAWNIIQNRQKKHGFPFNYKAAHLLYVELRSVEEGLKNEIYQLWPPELLPAQSYAASVKKNGEYTKQYLRHLEQFPKVERHDDGTYTVYDYFAFNLGSPVQRIAKLLSLGWKPINKTKKGNPKVDEDELLAFAEISGKPEVGKLARWIVVNSRANMLNTWLEAYNETTQAIHGNLFIAGTLRYKHSAPNSANIPAVRLKDVGGKDVIQYGAEGAWTYECRDLWTCGDPDEFVLVGIDGTGIQNRCLIHSLIKTVGEEAVKDFKELALAGDVHKRNIEVLGLKNKAAAKKFYYCVPLDARALTKSGWKGYEELIEGELVLTYNKETRLQEWQPVLEKVYFDDAPVVEMGNGRWKVRSTPNHRWFVQQRKAKTKWCDTPVEVRTTETLSTMQNIIVNGELSGCEAPSGIDWTRLPKYGTDWTEVVLRMSQQERRAFLAGFCVADGYQDANGDWRWSQLRGPLFEAALLASYLVHDGVVSVSTRTQENGNEIGTATLGKKPHVTTASFDYKECPDQPVWCIRTENESWVMRQGDVITITGNTLMMGGQGARLAADQAQFGTVLTAKEGQEKRDKMIASIPGFGRLIENLREQLKKTGRITLCDGTPILVPLPHMTIPYLLQGDESRLMKQALIYVYEDLFKTGLIKHVFKVADIHDEWQFKVRRKYVDDFTSMALPCFNRSGDYFNYLIPIDGDAKVGLTWAETH